MGINVKLYFHKPPCQEAASCTITICVDENTSLSEFKEEIYNAVQILFKKILKIDKPFLKTFQSRDISLLTNNRLRTKVSNDEELRSGIAQIRQSSETADYIFMIRYNGINDAPYMIDNIACVESETDSETDS